MQKELKGATMAPSGRRCREERRESSWRRHEDVIVRQVSDTVPNKPVEGLACEHRQLKRVKRVSHYLLRHLVRRHAVSHVRATLGCAGPYSHEVQLTSGVD